MRAPSETNLAKLKELGFKPTEQARAAMIIIGKIDVKKLEELALLDFVNRVGPPPGEGA